MKDRTKQNQYQRDWYYRNKAQRIKEVSDRQRELVEWARSLKTQCSKCPENDPVCLDFHHRNPVEKDVTIARAARSGWGKERLLREIAKCDILCANCHRKEHGYLLEVFIDT